MLYIEVRINNNKTHTDMKRQSRFKEQIEELTGTLADYGHNTIVLAYDNTELDKKERDLGLLLMRDGKFLIAKEE